MRIDNKLRELPDVDILTVHERHVAFATELNLRLLRNANK